jgi:hypothetical protein
LKKWIEDKKKHLHKPLKSPLPPFAKGGRGGIMDFLSLS